MLPGWGVTSPVPAPSHADATRPDGAQPRRAMRAPAAWSSTPHAGSTPPLTPSLYAFCWIAFSTRDERSGTLRTRAPVAAKIAFESAGATVVVPGSPTPVGYSLESTT